MMSVPGLIPCTVSLVPTIPDEAMEGTVLVHPNPAGVPLSVILEPTHTRVGDGEIVGVRFTVTTYLAVVVPQVLLRLYRIVSTPAVTPLTIPVLFTVAMPGLKLLHMPPVETSPSEIVEPVHTAVGPVIAATDGTVCTFTTCVTVAVPHTVVAV